MLLKDFREPLLSFELIYLTNFSVIEQRIAEVLGIKFGPCRSLGEKPNFLSPLRSLKF